MGTPQGGRHQVTDHTRIQEMGSWEADVGTGRREGGGGEIGEGRGRDWTLLGCPRNRKRTRSAEGEKRGRCRPSGTTPPPDRGEAGSAPPVGEEAGIEPPLQMEERQQVQPTPPPMEQQ